jgi:UDP-glucose 4-epimerase
LNILLTGGAGFIGSHVAEAYIERGHKMVILDDLSTGKIENIPPQAVFYKLDLLDPKVETIFKKENIQAINHHAAQISVTRSVADPVFDAEVNIVGSLKLLGLAVENKVEHVLFASTGGAIYGEQDYFPADENHPCRPLSPYGLSKYSVENYLSFYKDTHGLPATILRYSNVYGPRQDPHGEAGVVAIFCKLLNRNLPPVIFGDGEQTRDFVSVFDVAQANVTMMENKICGIYNVGTGKETSVNTLTETLVRLSGKKIQPKYEAPRPGEQRRSVIDYKNIHEAIDWTPKVSLEEGLMATSDYFSKGVVA